jgi:hypothetical protein
MNIYKDPATGNAVADVNGNLQVDPDDRWVVASDEQDPEHKSDPIKYDDLWNLVFAMSTSQPASSHEMVGALPGQYQNVQPVDIKPDVPDSTYVDPWFGTVVDHVFGIGFGDVMYTQAMVQPH